MGRHRGSRQRQKARRLIEQSVQMRRVYVYALNAPAWADAWPHLDDWFKGGVALKGYGRNRSL